MLEFVKHAHKVSMSYCSSNFVNDEVKIFFVLFYFFNHGVMVFMCLFMFLAPILNCSTCVYHVFTFIV